MNKRFFKSACLSKVMEFTFVCVLALVVEIRAVEASETIDKKYFFDIPSQSLSKSLGTVSELTERYFLFPYDLLEKKEGNSINGWYTAQQALDLLLQDTGFVGELSDKNVADNQAHD